MINEIAQNAGILGLLAGAGFITQQCFQALKEDDPSISEYKPGKWVRRSIWSARYLSLVCVSLVMLPFGMIAGGEGMKNMKSIKRKNLIRI